jgi:hypothetical protein
MHWRSLGRSCCCTAVPLLKGSVCARLLLPACLLLLWPKTHWRKDPHCAQTAAAAVLPTGVNTKAQHGTQRHAPLLLLLPVHCPAPQLC